MAGSSSCGDELRLLDTAGRSELSQNGRIASVIYGERVR